MDCEESADWTEWLPGKLKALSVPSSQVFGLLYQISQIPHMATAVATVTEVTALPTMVVLKLEHASGSPAGHESPIAGLTLGLWLRRPAGSWECAFLVNFPGDLLLLVQESHLENHSTVHRFKNSMLPLEAPESLDPVYLHYCRLNLDHAGHSVKVATLCWYFLPSIPHVLQEVVVLTGSELMEGTMGIYISFWNLWNLLSKFQFLTQAQSRTLFNSPGGGTIWQ